MSSASLFPDIPAGWLAVLGGMGAAIGGFVRSIWNGKNKEIEDRDKTIALRDATIDALRLKISDMQDKAIQALKDQLEQSAKRRETDERVARSIEETARLMAAHFQKPVQL